MYAKALRCARLVAVAARERSAQARRLKIVKRIAQRRSGSDVSLRQHRDLPRPIDLVLLAHASLAFRADIHSL